MFGSRKGKSRKDQHPGSKCDGGECQVIERCELTEFELIEIELTIDFGAKCPV